jgi:hypothetical protein
VPVTLTCQFDSGAPKVSAHRTPQLAMAAISRRQKAGKEIAWFVIDDGQLAQVTGGLRPVLPVAPDRHFKRRETERLRRSHPTLEVL